MYRDATAGEEDEAAMPRFVDLNEACDILKPSMFAEGHFIFKLPRGAKDPYTKLRSMLVAHHVRLGGGTKELDKLWSLLSSCRATWLCKTRERMMRSFRWTDAHDEMELDDECARLAADLAMLRWPAMAVPSTSSHRSDGDPSDGEGEGGLAEIDGRGGSEAPPATRRRGRLPAVPRRPRPETQRPRTRARDAGSWASPFDESLGIRKRQCLEASPVRLNAAQRKREFLNAVVLGIHGDRRRRRETDLMDRFLDPDAVMSHAFDPQVLLAIHVAVNARAAKNHMPSVRIVTLGACAATTDDVINVSMIYLVKTLIAVESLLGHDSEIAATRKAIAGTILHVLQAAPRSLGSDQLRAAVEVGHRIAGLAPDGGSLEEEDRLGADGDVDGGEAPSTQEADLLALGFF